MVASFDSILCFVLVAIIWGATNPFIKRGAQGIDAVKASSKSRQLIKEIIFLATNLKYIVPFLINQIGSVLFFLTLQNTDLSLAIPICNSLTFAVTAVAGWMLGEEKLHRNAYIGIILILLGTVLCCWDKLDQSMVVQDGVENAPPS